MSDFNKDALFKAGKAVQAAMKSSGARGVTFSELAALAIQTYCKATGARITMNIIEPLMIEEQAKEINTDISGRQCPVCTGIGEIPAGDGGEGLCPNCNGTGVVFPPPGHGEKGAWEDLAASGGVFAKERFEAMHDASGRRIDGYGDPAKGEYNAFLADDGSDIPCD